MIRVQLCIEAPNVKLHLPDMDFPVLPQVGHSFYPGDFLKDIEKQFYGEEITDEESSAVEYYEFVVTDVAWNKDNKGIYVWVTVSPIPK